MTLPVFRYHPDPIGSGSLIESDQVCRACGKARGYLYTGPVYSEEELDDSLCPWCIADGSAHKKFDATFVDSEAFDGEAPAAAVDEITERTPGFSAFQTEVWPSCCGDAAAFLAPAGIEELREQPGLEGLALNHIIYELGISGGAATTLLNSLHRDTGATTYVFQCLHCRKHLLNIDCP
jgi:uncharacterized protein CbrC (UPF0167 family)